MQQQIPGIDLNKLYRFGGKHIIKLIVLFFGLPMLFFGVAAYGIYFYNASLADEMSSWPHTEATITRSEVVKEVREEPVLHDPQRDRELKEIRSERRYHDVTYFIPSIAYKYSVDGTELIGRNYTLRGYSSQNKQEVENIVKDLQPGTVTRAYYNPNDHSAVALLKNEPPSSLLRYIAMAFVLGGLISVVVAIKI